VKLDGPFALPDLEQTAGLVRRVFDRYPNLRNDIDRCGIDPGAIEPADFVKMVRAALAYAGALHRTTGAVVKTRDYLSWLFEARDALTRIGYPNTDIRGSSFFVGCIVAGDIPYSPPRLWPQAEVGLIIGIIRDSYAATNKWMSVLAGDGFDSKLIIDPPALPHAPPPAVVIGPALGWRDELE
jgi:hypothetical protein